MERCKNILKYTEYAMIGKPYPKTDRIYVDAAAATPLSWSAKCELVRLLDIFGNPGALHDEALMAKGELARARALVAKTIGAQPDEIVFTSGGTEANNLAINGILHPFLNRSQTALNVTQSDCGKKVHAITSAIEHASVLEPLRTLQSEGLELTELKVDEQGLISIKNLVDAVTDNTVLISIQMVNSEIGTIEPIREIAKEISRIRKCRSQTSTRKSDFYTLPLYFHCDASQAPLWMSVKVEKLGVDLLTLDGQKIMGPKGVGVLYIKRKIDIEEQQQGGGQEGGRRSGTENLPLAGSFAVALADAQAMQEKIANHVSLVRNTLLKDITRLVPDVVLNGATGEHRAANNLNISIPGLDGEMAVIALNAEGVACSTRSACDSSDEKPSRVLLALKQDSKIIKGAIRLSLLPNATTQDAKRIALALAIVAKRYRIMS